MVFLMKGTIEHTGPLKQEHPKKDHTDDKTRPPEVLLL